MLSGNGTVGTGTNVAVTIGGTTTNYTVVVYGDVNGDGSIDLGDLVSIRNYLTGESQIQGAFKIAGNFYGESDISLNDLVGIMAKISNSGNISQNPIA